MEAVELSVRLLAGALLILANGFFVAIEFALTRVRQYPQSEFDAPGLRRAWEMTQDLEIYLTSCQVGISATSIAVGIVAEPALKSLLAPVFENTVLASIGAGGLVAFVIINLLHLTHGEQTPTYLGVEQTKFVARYGATPLYWFAKLLYPVILIGDSVAKWTLRRFGIEMTGAWLETETDRVESRAELRHRLGSLLDRGGLSRERKEEIINAFTVGEIPVSDVMTDREDIVFLSTAVSLRENLDRIGHSPHTRFPLIGDEPADFRGIVYVPAVIDRLDDLRRGEVGFEAVAAPPMTIREDVTISEAVDRFQENHQELALVYDESGTEVVGLLTATDALEAVMGEIDDPLDLEYGEQEGRRTQESARH
ncbi:Hemolysin, contains CBS domains [Halobiforma haloterrestris]|uniref:Hemolysin, contains CBS domains n=1 Tax=Natronobacterium haloterrestre TaxID=148448 RepID=A0A1I1IX19_NATHA|nr:hemolysin family protein [Halobiforma haloterrestris]SFC40725.1 Hemolysin, contains CBS domains [Halobiforma haloterrestris]